MINLLPPELKQNIMYARRNSHLLHWAVGIIIGLTGVLLVSGFGYMYMNNLGKSYDVQAQQAQADLGKQDPKGTQQQVEDITTSLKLVVQVLSREVLFSKLLTQIGASLPNGSSLTNLTIDKVQGGIDLQVGAIDYQTASQVQVNLADPKNQIFNKADIVSIVCGGNDPVYPCTTNIRAQFSTNNPFLYINNGSSANAVVKP